MNKAVKKQKLDKRQLSILALQTCQWWNAVFAQGKRFLDLLEKEHGGTPWDNENNSMFVAERMFLITAIHHAIENLYKLNIELQRNDDTSLQIIIQTIESVAPLADIKNLRDMNEHGLDYLIEKGKKQSEFRSTVKKDGYEILTTAAWTHVHGDAKVILLGNIQIDKLLLIMKEQMPKIKKKTQEIFYNGWNN